MKILENTPLAPLTTLEVGGPARYFVEAHTATEVRDAVDWARRRGVPLFVLGGGSNLVVADAGFSGLVIHIAIRGIEPRQEHGKSLFEVGAGEDWDGFVAHAVSRDCAGIECLSGIPGTVGGTPVQNVGAYGQEVSETIREVQALDVTTGEVRDVCNACCGFEYRTSVFNTSERGRWVILRVTFELVPGGAPRIEYADVKRYFAGRTPTLATTREAVREIRRSKSMLIVEGDEDCRSAGSFFKNPVLTGQHYQRLVARAAERGLIIPHYPVEDGSRKIPAAWLVQEAGFERGYTRGPVGTSRKHALAIVNRGGASAAEVIALKDEIQRGVRETFGIELEPEPVFVGFPIGEM